MDSDAQFVELYGLAGSEPLEVVQAVDSIGKSTANDRLDSGSTVDPPSVLPVLALEAGESLQAPDAERRDTALPGGSQQTKPCSDLTTTKELAHQPAVSLTANPYAAIRLLFPAEPQLSVEQQPQPGTAEQAQAEARLPQALSPQLTAEQGLAVASDAVAVQPVLAVVQEQQQQQSTVSTAQLDAEAAELTPATAPAAPCSQPGLSQQIWQLLLRFTGQTAAGSTSIDCACYLKDQLQSRQVQLLSLHA